MVTVAQSAANRKQHVLDLRKFTWLKPEKLLVIDASDVGWDTTPRGFIIQSPTGQSRAAVSLIVGQWWMEREKPQDGSLLRYRQIALLEKYSY